MDKDIISIIIPVYNINKRLNYCLESLRLQSYPFKLLEIILVDDGSTDGSSTLCDEYATIMPNVKVIHQSNKGPGITRNAGLEVACGEYIKRH